MADFTATNECYVGSTVAFTCPRLIGKQQHHIDYHHVIWSLVRKPGAFAAYRYREDLFPTTTFRLAYDRLVSSDTRKADRDYVRILHLAASISESEVEIASQRLFFFLMTITLKTHLLRLQIGTFNRHRWSCLMALHQNK